MVLLLLWPLPFPLLAKKKVILLIKSLSKLNVALYIFLCTITVWYVGHEQGEYLIKQAQFLSENTLGSPLPIFLHNLDVFQYAISYSFFLITSLCLARNTHYSKNYYQAAIIPMVYICTVWVIKLCVYEPDSQLPTGYETTMDCIVIPAILFSVTLLASINYIICAVQAKKQLGY